MQFRLARNSEKECGSAVSLVGSSNGKVWPAALLGIIAAIEVRTFVAAVTSLRLKAHGKYGST